MMTIFLPFATQAGDNKKPPPAPLTLKLDAPATNYGLEIREIRVVKGQNWIHAVVVKRGDMGGAAITPIKDSITPPTGFDPKKETRWLISGKTWNWGKAPPKATFIKTPTISDKEWKAAPSLWKRPADKKKG